MLVLNSLKPKSCVKDARLAHLTGFAKLLDSASPAMLPRLTKLHNWGHYSGTWERVKIS